MAGFGVEGVEEPSLVQSDGLIQGALRQALVKGDYVGPDKLRVQTHEVTGGDQNGLSELAPQFVKGIG